MKIAQQIAAVRAQFEGFVVTSEADAVFRWRLENKILPGLLKIEVLDADILVELRKPPSSADCLVLGALCAKRKLAYEATNPLGLEGAQKLSLANWDSMGASIPIEGTRRREEGSADSFYSKYIRIDQCILPEAKARIVETGLQGELTFLQHVAAKKLEGKLGEQLALVEAKYQERQKVARFAKPKREPEANVVRPVEPESFGASTALVLEEVANVEGATFHAVQADGRVWVATRRLAENMGVDGTTLRRVAARNASINRGFIALVGADGRKRPHHCVDVEDIPVLWNQLQAGRVKGPAREALQRFKAVAVADAIRSHFRPATTVAASTAFTKADLDSAIALALTPIWDAIRTFRSGQFALDVDMQVERVLAIRVPTEVAKTFAPFVEPLSELLEDRRLRARPKSEFVDAEAIVDQYKLHDEKFIHDLAAAMFGVERNIGPQSLETRYMRPWPTPTGTQKLYHLENAVEPMLPILNDCRFCTKGMNERDRQQYQRELLETARARAGMQ